MVQGGVVYRRVLRTSGVEKRDDLQRRSISLVVRTTISAKTICVIAHQDNDDDHLMRTLPVGDSHVAWQPQILVRLKKRLPIRKGHIMNWNAC